MAMRRPRIKAAANLMNSKRKPKNNVSKPTENPELSKSNTNSEEKTLPDYKIDANVVVKDKVSEKEPLAHELASLETVISNEEKERFESENVNENGNLAITDPNVVDKACSDDYFYDPPDASKIQDPSLGSKEEYLKNEPCKTEEEMNEETSFKCPPNVGYNRSSSHTVGNSNTNSSANNYDDLFHSDLEDVDVFQMDLIKCSNTSTCPMSPMSPSKTVARQRIRVAPVFGQRRNSLVGMSPSHHTGDESGGEFNASSPNRRERHFSASLSQASNSSLTHPGHQTPHKYVPSMGRIRTESGCSGFSDTYAGSIKSRKADDHHQQHRALSRREFESRFNNGVVPDKSTLKMFDLIYYNPLTNPMKQKPCMASIKKEHSNGVESKSSTPSEDIKFDSADSPMAIPVPQLKLNANGELILDDKSLEIETTGEQEARKVLASSALIYLDENTGMNGFYRKKKRTKDWPPEETIKFYRCLQTIGTDFSLMGQLFPNRTRRDLKLKFKKEERVNLTLINKALLHPKMFNIDDLQQQLETEERERAEADRKWKEIKLKEGKKLKKVEINTNPNASAAARALADGEFVYQNENATIDKKSRFTRNKNSPSQHTSTDGALQLNSEDQPVEPPAIKKRKRGRRKNITIENDCAKANSNNNDNDANNYEAVQMKDLQPNSADQSVESPEKKKRKRGRRKKIKIENVCAKAIHNDDDNGVNNYEAVQMEDINTHHQQVSTKTNNVDMDHNQLEQELADLLQQNNQTVEEITNYYSNIALSMENDSTPPPTLTSVYEDNKNFMESKSLVNLDDGTLTFVNDERIVSEAESKHEQLAQVEVEEQPHEQSNSTTACDMEESDIQQILTELAEGSMVLVSTLNPDDEGKVLNEIYMLDRNTGELCEKPLDIPDTIVQCILSVMS